MIHPGTVTGIMTVIPFMNWILVNMWHIVSDSSKLTPNGHSIAHHVLFHAYLYFFFKLAIMTFTACICYSFTLSSPRQVKQNSRFILQNVFFMMLQLFHILLIFLALCVCVYITHTMLVY